MSDPGREAYERGHNAGGIDERLAGHDKHFAAINGQLGVLSHEMHALTLAVQRLGDQAVSRDATVVTTAAALKDAEEARRDRSTASWSPWQKLGAGIAALASLVAIYLAVFR